MTPTRRPWWDRTAFPVVIIFGGYGTYSYPSHYSSLGWGFRVAIALVVACLLTVGCSLILDKLRHRFGQ
jgi:hypothetical protein